MNRELPLLEVFRTACAAFGNARDLAGASRLLLDNGKAAQSLALAVIGQEEFGKAFYLFWSLIGSFGPRNDILQIVLNRIFRHHAAKQVGAFTGALVTEILSSDALDALEQVLSSSLPRDADSHVLVQAVDAFASEKVPEWFAEWERGIDGEAVEAKVECLLKRELDRLKQSALYVDAKPDGRLKSKPSEIGRDVAEEHLGSLEKLVESRLALAFDPELFDSEDTLRQLADAMACRLEALRSRTPVP